MYQFRYYAQILRSLLIQCIYNFELSSCNYSWPNFCSPSFCEGGKGEVVRPNLSKAWTTKMFLQIYLKKIINVISVLMIVERCTVLHEVGCLIVSLVCKARTLCL